MLSIVTTYNLSEPSEILPPVSNYLKLPVSEPSDITTSNWLIWSAKITMSVTRTCPLTVCNSVTPDNTGVQFTDAAHLDYCNSLIYSISDDSVHHLQTDAAAGLVTSVLFTHCSVSSLTSLFLSASQLCFTVAGRLVAAAGHHQLWCETLQHSSQLATCLGEPAFSISGPCLFRSTSTDPILLYCNSAEH